MCLYYKVVRPIETKTIYLYHHISTLPLISGFFFVSACIIPFFLLHVVSPYRLPATKVLQELCEHVIHLHHRCLDECSLFFKSMCYNTGSALSDAVYLLDMITLPLGAIQSGISHTCGIRIGLSSHLLPLQFLSYTLIPPSSQHSWYATCFDRKFCVDNMPSRIVVLDWISG